MYCIIASQTPGLYSQYCCMLNLKADKSWTAAIDLTEQKRDVDDVEVYIYIYIHT